MTAIDVERTDDDIVPEAATDGDAGEPATEADAHAADDVTQGPPTAPPEQSRSTGERWPHRKPVLVTLVAVVALITAFAAGYGVAHEQSDHGGRSAADRQEFGGGRGGGRGGDMGGSGQHGDRGMQGERGSMQDQRGGNR